jgi:hypothetical protein
MEKLGADAFVVSSDAGQMKVRNVWLGSWGLK